MTPVVLQKMRGLVRIENPPMKHELAGALTARRVVQLRGEEKRLKEKDVEVTYIPLFQDCEDGSFFVFGGLFERVYDFYKRRKVPVKVEVVEPFQHTELNMSALDNHTLRKGQIKALSMVTTCDYGQFNGVTGMGKTELFKTIVRLYNDPNFRILICAQQAPVVEGIVGRLRTVLGNNVGQVGGGVRNPQRVTVSTVQSLRNIPDPKKIGLLLYDEVHTAAAPTFLNAIAPFVNAKKFGFSASTECRTDGADLLAEAYFGPVRHIVTLQEGQQEGYIPDVEAYFYTLWVPQSNASDTWWKRDAIWSNQYWNDAVERIAKYWERKLGPDSQILLMTDALEHALVLQKHLPNYTLVYRSVQKDRLERLKKWGLADDDFVPMKDKKRLKLIQMFSQGDLKKVISTTTLGVGVDAPNLDVIIRCDGGSSEVSNIQFRGRVTRGESGVYCDLLPSGDSKSESKGKKRIASARKSGWKVHVVDLPKPGNE